MAYVHKVPPDESLECVKEASLGSSLDDTVLERGMETKEDQIAQRNFASETEGVEAVTSDAPQSGDDASEMPVKEDIKPQEGDHPETLVGRGLESIGDLVVDTLQPVATVVGSVAQAPTVLMANLVGGFDSKPEEKDVAVKEDLQNVGSPNSPETTQGGDLLNVNSPTSSRGTPPHTPRGTPIIDRIEHLELQIAMLEERYNPKTISTEHNLSPTSQLTTPPTRERLRTARSLLRETESKGTLVERVYMLEARLNEHIESIERTLSCIDSKLAGVDSKLKHDQLELPASVQESNIDTSDTAFTSFAPPQLASANQGTQEPFVKDSSVAAPSGTSLEPMHKEDFSSVLVSSEPQLPSTLEEPMESVAKGTSAADPALVSSEPQLPSTLEEPMESVAKGTSAADPTLVSSEPQLPSTLEEPMESVAKGTSAADPALESVMEDNAEKIDAENVSGASRMTSRVEEPQNASGDSIAGAKSDLMPTKNEAEYKLAEDVEPIAKAPEARASYVMDPKPFGAKEKSSKKEKMYDGSKIVGGQSRENSLVRESEKDRHTFKHLRDRFRRAFRTRKD